jgi:hypothetical protein
MNDRKQLQSVQKTNIFRYNYFDMNPILVMGSEHILFLKYKYYESNTCREIKIFIFNFKNICSDPVTNIRIGSKINIFQYNYFDMNPILVMGSEHILSLKYK